ncbi:MAG: delta-aminolevulinic acid dehydratase [Acidobacteriota bacterium]
MPIDITSAHHDLWQWCRAQGFAGYDPYDGLNSRLFQATPFKHSRAARLAWTQFHKRSPINFRSLVRIPRERNSKGIALFTLAALANYRQTRTKEAEIDARELLDDLMWMRLKGFSGAAWGYNFDWQSRSFFAPRGTPTIVPTAFAARALCEAAEVFGPDEYLPFARKICDFILNDLNRLDESSDEVCFSYSPLDQTRVFNASLLAGEVLATIGKLTHEASLGDWAMRAARYVVRRQRADGGWAYGAEEYQSWADNFHTAFILTSLSRIIDAAGTGPGVASGLMDELDNSLRRGYEFWQERFFLDNGWPKYYPDHLYPADTHSAASAVVALVELRGRITGTMILAEKIAGWEIEDLRDRRGFFHHQRRRFHTVRIPYMRWSEAWMAYALARLMEGKK